MSDTSSVDHRLPPVWQQVQTAIWLIGLAVIAWQGWWWPGILVLVAISGLTQALLAAYVQRQEETRIVEESRATPLPENCPSCGVPISSSTVRWTGPRTAACPYCGSSIKAAEPPPPRSPVTRA